MADKELEARVSARVAKLVAQTEPKTRQTERMMAACRDVMKDGLTCAEALHVVWWFMQNLKEMEHIPFAIQVGVIGHLMGQPTVLAYAEGRFSFTDDQSEQN